MGLMSGGPEVVERTLQTTASIHSSGVLKPYNTYEVP